MKVAKHVLITGFEPFGGDNVNPSELVARSLEGRSIAGRPLVTRILPVATRDVRASVERAMLEEQPDIAIALGQAGGRTAVALERVAVNVLEFDRPDNAGVTCKNEPIVRGGPDARISGLPFDAVVAAWKEHDVPGYVSNSAGTYICNQVFYEMLGLAEAASAPIAAGFVHLPYLPAQAIAAGPDSSASMSFDLMKRAVELLIETLVPWAEHRSSERSGAARPAGSKMWIPRAKEIER